MQETGGDMAGALPAPKPHKVRACPVSASRLQ